MQERDTLQNWQQKWRNLQRNPGKERGAKLPGEKGMEGLQKELQTAHQTISSLQIPWGALFQEIEATLDEQISLLNVEPFPEKGELRILAEAKDVKAMTNYVKALRNGPLIKNAFIQNHHVQTADPQKPIRFLVQAEWNLDYRPETNIDHEIPVISTTATDSAAVNMTESIDSVEHKETPEGAATKKPERRTDYFVKDKPQESE